MEKNTSILLQKQIRDNSQDLQREFLEMQAWEEQMKKKDLQVRSQKDNEKILPPIRKKKKKSISNSETPENDKPSKTERIASSDYASWDKFDVEKACEEIDEKELKRKEENCNPIVESEKDKKVEDRPKVPGKEDNQTTGKDLQKKQDKQQPEVSTEEKLKKDHEEATKLKDEGNTLVQKQEYAKAVGKYSQAIKMFSGDAVFYANRALCQLKLDNLYSAESDCTEALRLNPNYIKAYHRRATARIELKRYQDAKKDLEIILESEPSNKEAICMLAQVEKILEKKPEPLIIAGEEKKTKKTSSIEKKIGEKLFAKLSKEDQIQTKPKKKGSKNIIEEIKMVSESENNKTKSTEINIKTKKEVKQRENIKQIESETIVKQNKKSKINNLPSGLTELKQDIEVVEDVTEVHKSKKDSKKIKIKEIEEIKPISIVTQEVDSASNRKSSENKTVSSRRTDNDIEKKINNVEKMDSNKTKSNNVNKKPEKNVEDVNILPPPPKSSVTFLLNWRKNISPIFRHNYLKQIKPMDLPDIFKESLESNILSEILQILSTKFIPNNDPVYDFLFFLTQVKRFRALILFMTKADKTALTILFEYCKAQGEKSDEDMQKLHVAYEM